MHACMHAWVGVCMYVCTHANVHKVVYTCVYDCVSFAFIARPKDATTAGPRDKHWQVMKNFGRAWAALEPRPRRWELVEATTGLQEHVEGIRKNVVQGNGTAVSRIHRSWHAAMVTSSVGFDWLEHNWRQGACFSQRSVIPSVSRQPNRFLQTPL